MDEFEVKKILEEKRKGVKTFDDLIEFIKDIKDNYGNGYGECVKSIGEAILATGWFLASEFGITGFQAGCVMWEFARGWQYTDNKCGLSIVDYDLLLYPQYDYKFSKFTIARWQYEKLMEVATERLLKEGSAHPNVIKRWKDLAKGILPDYVTLIEE